MLSESLRSENSTRSSSESVANPQIPKSVGTEGGTPKKNNIRIAPHAIRGVRFNDIGEDLVRFIDSRRPSSSRPIDSDVQDSPFSVGARTESPTSDEWGGGCKSYRGYTPRINANFQQ